jgi:valyl-tRNA synthetase
VSPRNDVLENAYDPTRIEEPRLQRWLDSAAWAADPGKSGAPYCIVIPPPNVTGALHMGHALNDTLQDILIRWRRMSGDAVLWQPGLDHAGIATQTVVERELRKEGIERTAMGRNAFIERVWSWKQQYGDRIVEQLKRLGCSADWDRLRFTMDAHSSKAVREAFVRLYDEGLIRRGTYLVNWCPHCRTALSDLEVEPEERDGAMHEIRYPLADGSGHITVATTRPETMLGDTGVAVNPDDPRYAAFIGREIELPLVGRRIPVVADAHVAADFGTGALKVTPAHDFNDAEIGARHGLPAISIFDEDARIVDGYGEFSGLDRTAARARVIERLEASGLLGEITPIRHAVGQCYRCSTTVEPFLSPQWFVSAKPLADRVLAELDAGRVRVLPEQWDKVLRQWLENIKDWCISRQIWWGHRIPVFTCDNCGHVGAFREDPTECPECAGAMQQEDDVLDTWFSSALWPMSTLGWPDETPDLARWYPNAALVTGFDILFFWVARMLMFGLHFRGEVPFRDVVLHAIVRDEHGEKMSKTRGNVVDPLDVIAEHGTDALRFTLASMTHLGRDIRLAPKRVEGYRHFANKLWNATRYVLRAVPEPVAAVAPAHPFNRWIVAALDDAARRAGEALAVYGFGEYCQTVYQAAWEHFCDWYIEGAKTLLRSDDAALRSETQATLVSGLETLLRLLHPVMPFVTEELAEALPQGADGTPLSRRAFPAGRPADELADDLAAFGAFAEAVRGIRNIRGENGLPPAQAVDVLLTAAPDSPLADPAWQPLLIDLARIRTVQRIQADQAPRFSATAAAASFQLWVPLEGLVDPAGEIERLTKLEQQARSDRDKAERKLANESFVERAPAEVVEEERRRLVDWTQALERLSAHLAMLRAVVEESK